MSGRRCGDLGERCKCSQRLQLDLACGPRCKCCKQAGSGRPHPYMPKARLASTRLRGTHLRRSPHRHHRASLGGLLVAERTPLLHEGAALFEQIATPVGGFDLVRDSMR
jgi:hypothetical protein